MKTLRLSVYVIIGLLIAFTLAPAKPTKKPHAHTALPTGIILHLPSDGAFQFYVNNVCGLDPSSGNYTNYTFWDYEIWPSGCYPDQSSSAAYGWGTWYPYPVQWVSDQVYWLTDNSIVRDFEFVPSTGFWNAPSYNYASEYDLCGNYLGEFLIQMTSAGYPANGEYWIDYDATGTIQVRTGTEPLDFDTFNQDGSNRIPRTIGAALVGDASGLPNLCP